MSAPVVDTLTAFRDVALRLHENGYRVIPIAPKGYEYHSRGKLKITEGKAPVEPGWEAHGRAQTLADVKRLIRKRPDPGWGAGIITAPNPALDIDVRHEHAAREIHLLADRTFGTMPVRYGAAPKRLLVGQTATPFPKVKTLDFVFPGDDKPHKVEILCGGQQFVAYAIHPGTDKPYWWDGDSPLDIPAADLPTVTREAAVGFVKECETILLRHGGLPKKKLSEQIDNAPKVSGETRGDPSLCRAALAAINNDDCDRDDWARMAYVVKGALGEPGYKDFLTWSRKAPTKHHNDETVKTLWDSTPIPDRIGAGTLFYLAGLYGWKRPTADAADAVTKLNETYALIIVGDKSVILEEQESSFRLLKKGAFQDWFANRVIQKDDSLIPLADYWLRSPKRRQFSGLIFAPGREVSGHFNLWRGFAVESKKGDCSKFLAHIHDNICKGDDKLFDWVMAWFAEIFQRPERKSGTALAIRGSQGVGKTILGKIIGSLLDAHYIIVADPRDTITGRFNSHMVSCLLLHADEGFWAGDHAAEGKLKDLVTGDKHPIEFKGIEAIFVDNYVRLLVTGNPNWVVPAGMEERRFATLDAGEDHREDHEYFAAIEAEMDNGGREALLHHLLGIDLSKVNLRKIPTTDALLDQKLASMTPEHGWWLDVLQRGRLPAGCDAGNECPSQALFNSYINHAGRRGARRRALETAMGIFMKDVVGPSLTKARRDYFNEAGHNENGSIYVFPPLAECRATFARKIGQTIEWDETPEWLRNELPGPG